MSMVLPMAGSTGQEHRDSLELLNGAGRMSQSLSTADSCDNHYQSPNRLSSNTCCANRNQTHCFLGDIPNSVCYKSTWFSIIKNIHCSK